MTITRPFNALGLEMLADLPPFLQDDPHVQGVINAYSKEAQYAQDRIDSLIAELFPQTATEVGLPFFEAVLGLTINPAGVSVDDRRTLVLAHFQAAPTAAGREWQASVLQLVGPGYIYAEYDPYEGNGGTPPAATIEIQLPVPSDSTIFAQVRSLIRLITPAHIDIIITSTVGFTLDASLLDTDTFPL